MILNTSAVGRSGNWRNFKHINYKALRKSWQYCILTYMQQHINTPEFKSLADKLYATYNNGFYVNAPPIKHFNYGVVNYIVRYAGRPVLAQSRIKHYDGKFVTFTYTPHGEDSLVTETLHVFDFIKRLIIHIPDRDFKMIRYFGFYSIRSKRYRHYIAKQRRIDIATLKMFRHSAKSWRLRIKTSFSYDPLKCTCGSVYELIDIFYPQPYKHKSFSFNNTS
jgi:hypothetical protein